MSLLLSASSTFEFDCLFRWVTVRSKLYAEISIDGGKELGSFLGPRGDGDGRRQRIHALFAAPQPVWPGRRRAFGSSSAITATPILILPRTWASTSIT